MRGILDIIVIFLVFFFCRLGIDRLAKTKLNNGIKVFLSYVWGVAIFSMVLLLDRKGWVADGLSWIGIVYLGFIMYSIKVKIEAQVETPTAETPNTPVGTATPAGTSIPPVENEQPQSTPPV